MLRQLVLQIYLKRLPWEVCAYYRSWRWLQCFPLTGPNDFHDKENKDRIAKFNNKYSMLTCFGVVTVLCCTHTWSTHRGSLREKEAVHQQELITSTKFQKCNHVGRFKMQVCLVCLILFGKGQFLSALVSGFSASSACWIGSRARR